MRKVITFLGTVARETVYRYEGQDYRGRVFGEALCRFLTFDEMLVFVTDEARRTAYPVLEAMGDPRIRPVAIPLAERPEELWQIFDILTGEIAPGDRVIFDITHALRSIPFLVFLASAYLRSAKGVTIERVLYGAFELQKRHGVAPVVDLTEVVRLLDWLMATDQFLETGDTRQLSTLLREAHQLPWRQQAGQDRATLPHHLQKLANGLDTLSRSLRLIRPEGAMQAAHRLLLGLEKVRPEAERWARPFALLLDRTAAGYRPLAMGEDPRAPEHRAEGLARQRRLLRWYEEHRQYVQAVLLAREWLVSYVLVQQGKDLIADREEAEGALWEGSRALRRREPLPASLRALPRPEEVVKLWDRARELRNDIAHAGMRPAPRKPNEIIRGTRELLEALEALPL
ncbi:MAG: TIGR02221 family CRISPR-associated protein [Chloroflexi bacterium]|nr:MAG: TIGR02221 family CRISPR-associated protein [Chloroflexota bacterium]